MHLPIIYQDEDYVAIDKPPGLLVHRTQLDAYATQFALQILRDQIGQEVFPCHRLDRPTSGILLFALNQDALRFAQNQFVEKTTHKEYHAVVRGWTPASGEIDYDLRSEDNPTKSKSAQTRYTRVSRCQLELPVGRYPTARFSLLKLIPLTGRKHQLRRHMAHIRHPILGDTCHGDSTQNRFLREHFGVQRLLLRATRLEIEAPNHATRLQLEAPRACEFNQLIAALKLP
ncbi:MULTISPECIES: pseudouridine synthase [unclassified Lentimonas]|uniref:pseudouridine synthase n=1 Tax=unclassified Lentimonas TaxID=2630993 RepID=UPI001321FAB1|nr:MULTISPECIES: pseudouridine synthase [unclassified Lentimonas]CAA6695111.1 tRNA pseudouridine synthase C (EC [Lentimonas sp. CC19]CAA6697225.1 tRNA pseudouridine synthase C (EC [Lentimonas sp. CC10]CAA7070467.1 tRNA pseudouridine synthase C (EC [Lentimonas sp. CC11]